MSTPPTPTPPRGAFSVFAFLWAVAALFEYAGAIQRGGALAFVLLVFCVTSPPSGHAAFPGKNGKIAFTNILDGATDADALGVVGCMYDKYHHSKST